MNASQILITLLEAAAVVALFTGYIFEDALIDFENKLIQKIKSKGAHR